MSYLEIITIITGLVGHYFIANQDYRGYYFWIVGNLAFIVMQYQVGLFGMVGLFVIYTYLSVQGIMNWKRKKQDAVNAFENKTAKQLKLSH